MKMPGPARQPTALKVLRGNPGKRALNKREPKPTPLVCDCPVWLKGEARKMWLWLVPELRVLRIATTVDREALTRYCVIYARWRQALRTIKRHGLTYASTNPAGEVYYRQRPEVRIAQTDEAQLLRLETEFGLTAASRARVSAPAEERDEIAERFFHIDGGKAKAPRGAG